MTIQSVPSPLFVQCSKGTDEDMYKPVDVNEKDYKGTLNTLPHPVLVLEKNKLQNYHYQIEVANFIGCSVKQISGIIIARYYYWKYLYIKHFFSLYNIYAKYYYFNLEFYIWGSVKKYLKTYAIFLLFNVIFFTKFSRHNLSIVQTIWNWNFKKFIYS